MDYLYTDIRFDSPAFLKYRSRTSGDGGLEPGKLVFVEDLERFAGKVRAERAPRIMAPVRASSASATADAAAGSPPSFDHILHELTGGREPARANLGGPSIVALIHAAQMFEEDASRDAENDRNSHALREPPGVRVRFFGARGNDSSGDELALIAARTPLDMTDCVVLNGPTPFTCVLSDPTFDHGHGERTFVNELGVAARFGPEHLPAHFYNADIVAFGGTALVPRIHESLGTLCERAKRGGSIVVVNTVFDFKSEARLATSSEAENMRNTRNPRNTRNTRNTPAKIGARWPLGANDETYQFIDILVMDREEALKLSGTRDIDTALAFFKAKGTGAAIVTDGARDIRFFSSGGLFAPIESGRLPVSAEVTRLLQSAERPPGDTTGCGDNFVGGLLRAVAAQREAGAAKGRLDMEEACAEAVVAGGFACFYIGGTYFEASPGEKRHRIELLAKLYRAQRGRQ